MGILLQNKKVGLALLCDNAPYTLAMTLASYGRSGLLGYFDEACAVFPESAVKVRETALSHGLSAVAAPVEGGFIGALHTAVNALDTDYVLLAEDDCMIWEHLRGENLEKQLKRALDLLISGQADMCACAMHGAVARAIRPLIHIPTFIPWNSWPPCGCMRKVCRKRRTGLKASGASSTLSAPNVR